jgi:retron-type reverse transcriptase
MKIPSQIDFTAPVTANDLAPYLRMDAKLLLDVIASKSRSEFYFRHQIAKRSRHRKNESRTVWQTAQIGYFGLIDAHKAFARRFDLFARLADEQFPHEAAFGYVRHRGTRDNAAVHCGAPILLRADLRNFFPSISKDRLEKRFLELNMKGDAADALARFATIEDSLPLGLNASPMLANLVCVYLDQKIQTLSDEYDCKYTRYADDIYISGKSSVPTKSELEKIVTEEGFNLRAEKFRITKLGQAHYVTGLSISDPNGPHAPRRMKRKLRQELYYSKKYGIEDHLSRASNEDSTFQREVNRLDGTVQYVSHIEEYSSNRTLASWQEIMQKEGVGPSYNPIELRPVRYVTCFVDESEICFEGKIFLALGLVFTEDASAMTASTAATLRKYSIEDPFYAGNKEALWKKGIHFVDAHPDLRADYINVLAGLPYRAFVIYSELGEAGDYAQLYIALMIKALRKRFIWYDRAVMEIIFEENSKIKMTSLKGAISEVYGALEKESNRRPIVVPKVTVGKKLEHLCFAAPDFLLAVFLRYAVANKFSKEGGRIQQFERLRDKYRTIVDFDTGAEFSRRRPFAPWPKKESSLLKRFLNDLWLLIQRRGWPGRARP